MPFELGVVLLFLGIVIGAVGIVQALRRATRKPEGSTAKVVAILNPPAKADD